MTNTTGFTLPESTARILEDNHMTATIATELGRYTVVSRPGFVVVVRDNDGEVQKGTHLKVKGDRVYLYTPGRVIVSRPLTHAYILSN